VILCRLGGSRAGKTLAFSRPSRTDAWCGCLSVWSCSGWVLSQLACSLPIYLAVYYLCRLQMPMSLSCPSSATNMYVCLFPSPPALRNLRSGGVEGWGSLFCCLWYPHVHKNIMRRAKTINKKLDIFLVDNLCGYCYEPSQRTGNRLV
jgi:hypothetical protein